MSQRPAPHSEETEPSEPLVTVGIPAFQRPAGLASTLRAMRRQTHRNLRIIVSDNCSEPSLEPVVRTAAEDDPRVEYHRQPRNVGVMANFHWLVQQARSPYFMWAADDDDWDDNWIAALRAELEPRPDAMVALGRFQYHDASSPDEQYLPRMNLDRGRTSRMMSYFLRADARVPHSGGIGGAMLYGLFRTPIIQREWPVAMQLTESCRFRGRWNAPDLVFVYYLLQHGTAIDSDRTTMYYTASRRPAVFHPDAAHYLSVKKVRSHLRDLTQSVVHNADYLRVQQPVASRVLATLAYGPKVLSLWARHETAIAKGLLFSRRDRGAT